MTMKQFRAAYRLADELATRQDACDHDEIVQASIALSGCAYEKKYCTLRQYAIIFNWQTMQLNGIRDQQAVEEELAYLKNITIIDQ